MKNLTYLFSAAILLVVLTTFGCGEDDPDLTEEEVQLNALTGTWVATKVGDGVIDDRQDYKDFTLTINKEMTYSTAGGPDLLPMPEAGAFAFNPNNVKGSIIIAPSDANITATYALNADSNVLTLSFTYEGAGFENTRTNSVNGTWTFTFSKQ